MTRRKLTLAYDGSSYAGWQVQAGQPTVQAALQAAFAQIQLGQVDVTGASRTDAGVHAIGQVCHIDLGDDVNDARLVRSLNGVLPRDIRVLEIADVPDDFHARYNATAKTYRYLLACGPAAPPALRHVTWHHPAPLDHAVMAAAVAQLIGEFDFAAFQAAGSDVEDTVRRVFDARFRPADMPGLSPPTCAVWAFDICGNGFLYKMVRSLVGTLVEIGTGRGRPTQFADILQSGERTLVGATAPAAGLTLCSVHYAAGQPALPEC